MHETLWIVLMESGGNSTSIWWIISPFLVLIITMYLNWRLRVIKKFEQILVVQSYLMFLVKDNIKNIRKQEKLLREAAKKGGSSFRSYSVVSSINIQEIIRIPQNDVFNALVLVKIDSDQARQQYQVLSGAIMLASKTIIKLEKEFEYYIENRKIYERNLQDSSSDLHGFFDDLKYRESGKEKQDPVLKEIIKVYNKFADKVDNEGMTSRMENEMLVEPMHVLIKGQFKYPHFQEAMKILRECRRWYMNFSNIDDIMDSIFLEHAGNLADATKDLSESFSNLSLLNDKNPSIINWVRV